MIDMFFKAIALIIFASPFICCALLIGVTIWNIFDEIRCARKVVQS